MKICTCRRQEEIQQGLALVTASNERADEAETLAVTRQEQLLALQQAHMELQAQCDTIEGRRRELCADFEAENRHLQEARRRVERQQEEMGGLSIDIHRLQRQLKEEEANQSEGRIERLVSKELGAERYGICDRSSLPAALMGK